MQKIITLLLTTLFTLTPLSPLLAQETNTPTYPNPEARITIRESFRTGESIFIDGTTSQNPNPDYPLRYHWTLGDGSTSTAKNFQYLYTTPGNYTITLTVSQTITELNQNGERQTQILTNETSTNIFVYNSTALIIHDQALSPTRLTHLHTQATTENFHFTTIDTTQTNPNLTTEETLNQNLTNTLPALRDSSIIFIYTDSLPTLNALNKFHQLHPNEIDFTQKTIALVTNHNMTTASRLAQSTLLTLNPQNILIIREPAIDEIIPTEGDPQTYITTIQSRGYEHTLITPHTTQTNIWNAMSQIIAHMINQGTNHQTILYLLLLPIIVTIIALFRQTIGFSTAGIYPPTLITLTLIFAGLPITLITLTLIILASLLARLITHRRRLLFTPRIAFTLTLVTLTLFIALAITTTLAPTQATTITILPILLLTTLSEKITILSGNKSSRDILKLFLEITIVALITYLIVAWTPLQTFIFAYPEATLLFLLTNYLLGRWTGLRLFEYFRFRTLLRELVSTETEEE